VKIQIKIVPTVPRKPEHFCSSKQMFAVCAIFIASHGLWAGEPSPTVSSNIWLYGSLPATPGPTFRPDLAPIFTQRPVDLQKPQNVEELLALSPAEMENVDMARRNLLCAVSLPGAEDLDIEKSLAVLDELTQQVKAYTEKHLPQFRENPHAFKNEKGSEAYFRTLMLVSYLHSHWGISYNPELKIPPGERKHELTLKTARDSRNVYLHGLLFGRKMGTCASIPALIAAVGQRLGYPIRLANTKCHMFARWETPTERFNIEATQGGLQTPSDDSYKKFPYPIDEETIRNEAYLKTMTAAEEVADCLVWRGIIMMYTGRNRETTLNALCIQRLVPHIRRHDHLIRVTDGPPPLEIVDGEGMPVSPEWAGAIPVVWQPTPEESIQEIIDQKQAEDKFWEQIRNESEAMSRAYREADARRIAEMNAAAPHRSIWMPPQGDNPFIPKSTTIVFDPARNAFVEQGQYDSFSPTPSSGRPTNPYGMSQAEYLKTFGIPTSVAPGIQPGLPANAFPSTGGFDPFSHTPPPVSAFPSNPQFPRSLALPQNQ
jgi:hypothetical protein